MSHRHLSFVAIAEESNGSCVDTASQMAAAWATRPPLSMRVVASEGSAVKFGPIFSGLYDN